ncbi:DNA starvation/stationary phase protection protein [Mariniflexile litorale]|uniref:DNA starvation/stationary phase protection protein n=1 Tax=Mariniflexile litorale TaxID=3045158 RepID=A0AAU7EI57_9FLAO|nr:DNA starvation/stationary phase protection protein [Mariniflexile sp. KMM 9835]MDQ8210163.1 DNA starvation/stationary phase protection protein [Mariniflexile sp. KMM 9835]
MKTDIGITEKNLKSNIEHLTVVLSNAMILYVKTRKFHWNVTGPSFMELHKLFENQYNDLEKDIDEIAERISKLGGKSIGTMKEFIKHGSLKESETDPSQKVMIEELLSDHEAVIKELRDIINSIEEDTDDMGTSDFLTALLLSHESKAWVLRKYTK